jgi:hypothetical protein
MFSKISRYRKLDDVVVSDSSGRLAASKALRLIPEVDGEFLHTVEENDRLDHLAFKYYKQPRKWWRICDANPDFPFPPALLGKDTLVVERFPVLIDTDDDEPLWSEVLADLNAIAGVEQVRVIKEELALVERAQTIGPDTVTLIVPKYGYTIIVHYNGMNLSSTFLVSRMVSLNLEVGPPERVGRIGKTLIIPPNTVA